ncbi:MAG: tyrosine-protein phosphatase [Cyclobacteriaceae bacterium]
MCTLVSVAQPVTIQQNKDNNFEIAVTSSPPKYKLFWSAKPDSWDKAQVLSLKSSPETIALASAHPILKLEDKNEKFYAAPRAIKLQGAANFRDIGGYKTTDGKQVKWGKMYRSADISKLTDADLQALSQLNIKMICDLRGEKESEAAPDKMIAGAERILLPAGSENVGGTNNYMKYMTTPQRADSMIRSFYTRTDHLKAKYKPMFDQLLAVESDKALLFHCAGGKDRTGVGAAFILYALGVDEKTILKDYELTNEYLKDSREEFIKMFAKQGVPENSARSMMAADPDYLKSTFDTISKKYGSMDKFLETEMELTAKKREELKKKFLY